MSELVRISPNGTRVRTIPASLSLGDVAEHVGLSPNYFSYVFKQKTGDRFIKYLTNLRLAEAKVLLKTTNLTTVEIAEKIGYNNVILFSHKIAQ